MTKLTEFQRLTFAQQFLRMVEERDRQCAKFGPQHATPDFDPELQLANKLPGIGKLILASQYEIPTEDRAKLLCEGAFENGRGSWAHIVVEELAEVFGATNDDDRCEELMQLATCCIAWIEVIKSRKAPGR